MSFPRYFPSELRSILTKLASRNQLTLPKVVMSAIEGTEYLDVIEENGRVVLTPPVRINRADAVCAKLAELGVTETDVADAVDWARGRMTLQGPSVRSGGGERMDRGKPLA